MPPRRRPLAVLTVCTGNLCRSPMAEAFLAAKLGWRGVAAHVESAGLLAAGRPSPEPAIAAMAAYGLDISAHMSMTLTAGMLDVDLVLGMATEHVRHVAVERPGAWNYSFTLAELVERAHACGSREDGEAMAAWLARCGEGRSTRDLMGSHPAWDIEDPFGSPPEEAAGAYARVAHRIDTLTSALVDLIAPARPQR